MLEAALPAHVQAALVVASSHEGGREVRERAEEGALSRLLFFPIVGDIVISILNLMLFLNINIL